MLKIIKKKTKRTSLPQYKKQILIYPSSMYLLANRNLVGLGYGRTKITKSKKKITLFLSFCVLYIRDCY